MDSMPKLYTIKNTIAYDRNIPRTFHAVILRETSKAVYMYGRGCSDPEIVIIDCWIPKSAIKSEVPCSDLEPIQIPKDHPIFGGGYSDSEKQKLKMTVTINTGRKSITIKFPYDSATVGKVRCLEGRRWDPVDKSWTAFACVNNLKSLQEWGFELCETSKKILLDSKKPPLPEKEKMEELKNLPESFDTSGLYPFQIEGVRWLESKNGNGLIGDEMGLGKTVQAVSYLKLHPEMRPAIIVVPASLKLNWEREIKKWMTGSSPPQILSGTKPHPLPPILTSDIFIINYDILGPWMDFLLKLKPQILIVDECHYVKNIKAGRTKAIKELSSHCEHKIFLSGTPITNRPDEFYTTLNILNRMEFPSWFQYVKRYCGAFQSRYGWQTGRATNTEELHEKINGNVMLRRKKEEVLKDLPPKVRNVVPLEINNEKEYREADDDLVSWVRNTFSEQGGKNLGNKRADAATRAEALARFNYLKQLATKGVIGPALSWIKDSLNSNGKLVVFCVHHNVTDLLKTELAEYCPVVLDGRTPVGKRQELVDRFQNDGDCRVFIGNIRAAGVGITLTAASNVVFLELGWTPGEMTQAEDRIHRIGQEAESITAWYLIASGTIIEEIAELLDTKRKVLDAVLDGVETDEENLLIELLNKRMN